MSTTVITDDAIGVLHSGLSHHDLRAGNSIFNVTMNARTSRSSHARTSKGVRSLLAEAQAKKAALIAKLKRLKERIALEQQKIHEEEELEQQQQVRTEAQHTLLVLPSKLKTNIQEQETIKQVNQQCNELTGLHFPTPETRRNAQVSDTQSQTHVDSELVHDANAPTATSVTMRRKQVTILDDVIDSGQHSARVDSHVSSSASTGEANREQDLSNHYRGDAMTSAGAITHVSGIMKITRQIPASLIATCGEQPRSKAPETAMPTTTLQEPVAFNEHSQEVAAPSLAVAQTTNVSQPVVATNNPHTSIQGVMPQRPASDHTPQQVLTQIHSEGLDTVRDLRAGDSILECDENTTHGQWPMGVT